MILKKDGPVNMTPGGDQDVNLYLLEVTNGKAI